MLPVDSRLALAIRNQETEIAALLKERGIKTLRESALQLLEDGLTSLEEVLPLLNE